MEFPQILLQLKNQRRYTNAYIGNACGVSEGAVRTWLLGKKAPSSKALNSLSNLFGVSTDYLLGKEQVKGPNGLTITIRPEEMQLIKEFRNLSPDLQDFVLSSVRAQAEKLKNEHKK